MDSKYFEIMYEDLALDALKDAKENMVKIIYKEEDYYFKISLKSSSNKLMIHSNGAVDHAVKAPPVAQRSSWSNEVNANCIFLDDKTLHDKDISIGWGVGTPERYYLEDYSVIVKRIQELLNIKSENVFYWGSSAGGFMSMVLSSMHNDTTAIVNNPQTLVLKFYKSKVDQLLNNIFNGISEDEAFKLYPERLSVVEAIKKYGYTPKIIYIQNNQFKFDMVNHFQEFRNDLTNEGILENKNMYLLYNDYENGHNPLPKERTIKIINATLEGIFL